MRHVAILKPEYIEKLIAGTKLVEARLLRRRTAPYGLVRTGDLIYLKPVGGEVSCVATAGWVRQLDDLTPVRIAQLAAEYETEVQAPDEFWALKSDARYGVFIRLAGIRAIDHDDPMLPVIAQERAARPRSAWIKLPELDLAFAA